MSPADLYVRNGRVVTASRDFVGGVVIADGRVREVIEGNPTVAANEVIDATGMLVVPGLVDAHVHFSEPGRGHWEGFATGSRAAAAGGITTFVEMPLNAHPPTINAEALALKKEAVKASIVDYALWGGLVDNNLADLESLHAGGVVGFKAFMVTATDFARSDRGILKAGMQAIARLGSFLAVHAEDEEMTARLTADLRAQGRKDRRAWGEARPISAELLAIDQATALAEETGVRLHVVHVSSAAGVDRVSAAKARGVSVTAETCPHYLFFDESDLDAIGPLAKCAPPLRAPSEREALWDRVIAGHIDVIASDHSPCLIEEKTAGDVDIFEAWGGISGLQSTLPAMLTEGVHSRGLSLNELVRMISLGPARLFGLWPSKGDIVQGGDADLVIVDPDATFVLTNDALHYRNPHSAYVGQEFKGRVVRTLCRGRTVFDGETTVDSRGRWLR